MEDEEIVIPCFVCGEPATKNFTFMPTCNNVVCFQVRKDTVLEEVKKMYKEKEKFDE